MFLFLKFDFRLLFIDEIKIRLQTSTVQVRDVYISSRARVISNGANAAMNGIRLAQIWENLTNPYRIAGAVAVVAFTALAAGNARACFCSSRTLEDLRILLLEVIRSEDRILELEAMIEQAYGYLGIGGDSSNNKPL